MADKYFVEILVKDYVSIRIRKGNVILRVGGRNPRRVRDNLRRLEVQIRSAIDALDQLIAPE